MKKTVITSLLMAAAFGCQPQQGAQTATEPSDENTKEISVGDVSITWIKDKPGETKQTQQVFNDTPDSILTQLGLQDGIPSSISCFLMKTDGQEILFDAGLGMEASLLTSSLAQQGKQPSDIKLIFITHLHGDHIGGMLKDGNTVFTNAEVYLNKVEHDAWLAMPEENNAQQRALFQAYADHLHLFNIGDTLPAGVIPMEAYGHTPGHTVFQKNQVLVIGDLMHGAELQLKYPEYCPFFDMDKQMATESRKRILEYAQNNHLVMAGMHLPDPAFISYSPDVEINK